MTEQSESRAVRVLREIVESGRPLVYVRSAEEQRVTALLREVASRLFSPPAPLWIWTITEGMRRDGSAGDGKTVAPRAALDFVASHKGPGVFLLNDFHEPMREGPDVRRRLRDLYLPGWYRYLAIRSAGLVPWAPVTDRDREAEAATHADEQAAAGAAGPGGFAEHLDEAPVLLAVLADLRALAAIDLDHDRYTFTGGASVYPFCWNVLLAARARGLGGVITTFLLRAEPAAAPVLGLPPDHALAAVIFLGHPVHQPTKLRRAAVEDFTTIDRFGGEPFTLPAS